MHAFYRSPENERNNNPSSGASNNSQNVPPQPDGDDFDELARYFLPLAGSLLGLFLIFRSMACIWFCIMNIAKIRSKLLE